MLKSFVVWSGAAALACGGVEEMPHPRLWMTKSGEQAVRDRISRDPLAARLHERILAEADAVLKADTCRYDIPDGRRLLAQSRLALHNIGHCAWAWRFTGKKGYLDRAVREMEAACSLKDWNPSHFLDTAEMALAVGWGFDWLHEGLSEEQRAAFWAALTDKGLHPARDLYRKQAWWAKPRNNWAQVCGGGIALAAMATAERDPGLCGELLERGVKLIEECHQFYQPDGMYPEGPGYWHYGTDYHIMLQAACGVAGVPFQGNPIMAKSGLAIMHLTGGSGAPFNFADSWAGVARASAAQCWIATQCRDGAQAKHVRDLYAGEIKRKSGGPLELLWLPEEPGQVEMPREAVFRGEQAVAVFRTSWAGDSACFAIKGGTPRVSHGQMDVGSFVYDAFGERWFHDLGPDNYNLPGYFGKRRWDYFRMQNRSHNTLEIGGKLQNADAEPSGVVSSGDAHGRSYAAFDLTAAYAGSAERVGREVRFDKSSGSVELTDEIEGAVGEIVWRGFTDAEADVRGRDVVLRRKGKSVVVRNESKTGEWSVESAAPPTAEENPNKGFVVVTLRVPEAKQVKLVVKIEPLAEK